MSAFYIQNMISYRLDNCDRSNRGYDEGWTGSAIVPRKNNPYLYHTISSSHIMTDAHIYIYLLNTYEHQFKSIDGVP